MTYEVMTKGTEASQSSQNHYKKPLYQSSSLSGTCSLTYGPKQRDRQTTHTYYTVLVIN